MKPNLNHFVILAVIATLLSGCGDSGKKPQPVDSTPKVTPPSLAIANLSGLVKDSEGIAGATITVGEISVTSDINGYFLFENIELTTDKRWLVSASKNGYIGSQQIVNHQNEREQYMTTVILVTSDTTKVVDLTTIQTVTLNGNQASIELPANAVKGGDNESTISITYGDPSTDTGRTLFPGNYTATNDIGDPADILLESIAFIDFSLSDKMGNDLTSLDQPATVTLRLPPIYQAMGERAETFHDGDTIAWWSYNEDHGVWLREDADVHTIEIDDALISIVDGVLFATAHVSHFSWWNLDQPLDEQACVSVKLVDADGEPLAGLEVFADGTTYNAKTDGLTDADGNVSITVKRTQDSSAPEGFKLTAKIGEVTFVYDLNNTLQGDPTTNVINSPDEIGTAQGDGECTLLEDPFVIKYAGTLEGVVYDVNGELAVNQAIQTSFGEELTTDAQGRFSLPVPHQQQVFLVIQDKFGQAYSTSEEQPITSIVINLNSQPVVVSEITATPNQGLTPGTLVILSIDIEDFDQHTVNWAASVGDINSTGDTTALWVVPEDNEAGSAKITVSVIAKDQRHASAEVTLNWQAIIFETPLYIGVNADSRSDSSPSIEGIQIILHSSNGVDTEQSLLTDADGIVNFGIIDRSQVTFSIIEPYSTDGTATKYNITTVSDFPTTRGGYYPHRQTTGDYEVEPVTACVDSDPHTAFQAQFTNIPNDVKQITILGHPGSVYDVPDNQEASEVIEMSLCSEASYFEKIQLIAQGANAEGNITAYSLEIQRDISDSDAVAIFSLNQQPTILPITVEDLPSLSLIGTSVGLFERALFVDPEIVIDNTSITVAAYEFDNSLHYVQANSVINANTTYQQQLKFTSLPSSLSFIKPSFSLESQQFDAISNRYSWVVNNPQDSDSLTIVRISENIHWTIHVDPTQGVLTLPGVLNALDLTEEQPLNVESVVLLDVSYADNFGEHAAVGFLVVEDNTSLTYILTAPDED